MQLELETEQIIARVEDGVGWVIFNQPERHNALSAAMLRALPQVMDTLARDDEVRVVVLRGAGEKAFVSGADLTEMGERTGGDGPRRTSGLAGTQQLDKPLIAMIHGYCLGGGLLVALSADIRLASDDAQFGIPAARLGVGYPFDATRALVETVGPAAASEILFSGARFDATRALRMGLVSDVVPKAELEDRVRGLARTIAGNAPLTVRAAKACIQASSVDAPTSAVERCQELVSACWSSADFAEGRRAFAEKRLPVFQGR